jgi:integrase
MKRTETVRTSTASTNRVGGKSHHEAKFTKVLDGRKRAIRGLWKRNDRFYAQLTVFDPITGRNRVQRISLLDKQGEPIASVAQAVAVMEGLRTKRRDTGLDAQIRRAPEFGDYADRYLDAISAGAGAKKHRVVIGERAMLKQWRKHLGDIRLDQIRKAQVNDFITKRLKAGRSPRTCNLNVVVLRNVIKRAIEDGFLPANPIAGLKLLKVTTAKRSLCSAAEIDKVVEATSKTRTNEKGETVPVTQNAEQFADYIRFLQFTGAREKEALNVKWADVDFDGRRVTIGADGDTKNHKGRTVDFNPKLSALLTGMRKRRAPDSQWLFPSPQRGERDIPARSFRESLNLTRAAASMPKFGFHDCRHHFISMAVMLGVDYMTIASWVGHQDGGVLIGKVYGHLANEHKMAMAEKLNFGPAALEKAANQ